MHRPPAVHFEEGGVKAKLRGFTLECDFLLEVVIVQADITAFFSASNDASWAVPQVHCMSFCISSLIGFVISDS